MVLPTRNSDWCLPYCLNSIKKLDPQPDEILICVGKSRDKTEDIVLRFQKESSTPVRVFYDREGNGTGYAMNLMVPEATNELIIWIGSDHILPSNFISFVCVLFEKHGLSWLQGVPIEIDPKDIKNIVAKKIDMNHAWFKRLKGKWSPIGSLEAFNKSDVLKVGNFDPYFSRSQDTDILVRLTSSDVVGGVSLGTVHAGLLGKINFKKALINQTFWKLFYKYGWKYCIINKHHFFGMSLRMAFITSLGMLLLSFFINNFHLTPLSSLILLPLFISSFLGLVTGIIISYRRININLILIQIVGSVGEFYQLIKIIFKYLESKRFWGLIKKK